MIEALITFLIYAIIIGVLAWAIDFVFHNIPFLQPMAGVIRVVLTVLVVVALGIMLLMVLRGGLSSPGIVIPRID